MTIRTADVEMKAKSGYRQKNSIVIFGERLLDFMIRVLNIGYVAKLFASVAWYSLVCQSDHPYHLQNVLFYQMIVVIVIHMIPGGPSKNDQKIKKKPFSKTAWFFMYCATIVFVLSLFYCVMEIKTMYKLVVKSINSKSKQSNFSDDFGLYESIILCKNGVDHICNRDFFFGIASLLFNISLLIDVNYAALLVFFYFELNFENLGDVFNPREMEVALELKVIATIWAKIWSSISKKDKELQKIAEIV